MCVMGKFNGKRVLITGAASGIGRIMGAMALEKGAAALVISITEAEFNKLAGVDAAAQPKPAQPQQARAN